MSEHVAVIIVSWNTTEYLRSCLGSLKAVPENWELEVVVVDNGSIDGSPDMVEREFPGTRMIRNTTNEGFGRANNQGFATTSAPYVLFLNSDTEVSPQTIPTCVDYLKRHHDVAAVGCRIIYPDGSPQNSIFRFPSLWAVFSVALYFAQLAPTSKLFNRDRYGDALPNEATDVEVVMGSFMLCRRTDLLPEPFDDDYFMYAEEADLCDRLAAIGKRVVYLPSATIAHQKGGSSRTWAQRAWSDEAKKRAQLMFLRKRRGSGQAYLANLFMLAGVGIRVIPWLVADIAAGLRGKPTGRFLKARALGFHLRSTVQPSLVAKRFHGPPAPTPVDG